MFKISRDLIMKCLNPTTDLKVADINKIISDHHRLLSTNQSMAFLAMSIFFAHGRFSNDYYVRLIDFKVKLRNSKAEFLQLRQVRFLRDLSNEYFSEKNKDKCDWLDILFAGIKNKAIVAIHSPSKLPCEHKEGVSHAELDSISILQHHDEEYTLTIAGS